MRSGEVEGLGDLRWELPEYTRGAGIELGFGPVKAYPHFVAVRLESDDTKGEHPDYVCEDFHDLGFLKDHSLDFIVEHEGAGTNAQEVLRVLKNDGYLCSARNGELHTFRNIDGKLVRVPLTDTDVGPTVCVVRYGAIGDTLQATSILPELKRQGYHVTWLCEPTGYEYLKGDPQIDAFIVNDKDQLPNHWLQPYWTHVAKRFDRFINLCESVEGSLIKLPGRADFHWPWHLRQRMCNVNYLEFIAGMADVKFSPEHHFHESDEEASWADDYIAQIAQQVNRDTPVFEKSRKPYVVMWALAGSSVHKFYPHQDDVIMSMLQQMPEAHVVLVGDAACVILEAGWEKQPRVHRESGVLDIRRTLALAKRCNLVIGPETGVLNAVAFESCAKVCLLSHSSAENLTKHWTHTYPLAGSVPCYPCHRMHYTREHCPEDKTTGASACMAALRPEDVFAACWDAYHGWSLVQKMMEPA